MRKNHRIKLFAPCNNIILLLFFLAEYSISCLHTLPNRFLARLKQYDFIEKIQSLSASYDSGYYQIFMPYKKLFKFIQIADTFMIIKPTYIVIRRVF